VALRHPTPQPGTQPNPIFRVGQLRVDLARRLVWVQDEQVHLTPNEYKLLATLVQHAGKVLTHRQLLSEVGELNTWRETTIYASTWLSCAINWKESRRGLVIC
jgi:DNA-binding response OmpR family regulator